MISAVVMTPSLSVSYAAKSSCMNLSRRSSNGRGCSKRRVHGKRQVSKNEDTRQHWEAHAGSEGGCHLSCRYRILRSRRAMNAVGRGSKPVILCRHGHGARRAAPSAQRNATCLPVVVGKVCASLEQHRLHHDGGLHTAKVLHDVLTAGLRYVNVVGQ